MTINRLLTLVKMYAIFTEQSGDVVALNEASSNLHPATLVHLSKIRVFILREKEVPLTQTITQNDSQVMTSF
jgi:hypothetical protein